MDSTSTNESQTSSRPSPVKNVNASPQVYVITPNQLAKLGLSTQIHSLIATQVQSKQTTVERESITLDNNEEQQSLSISSSTASHLEDDESNIFTETRESVNIGENTSSALRNEMKSKLHYLLNTNESIVSSPLVTENANTSVIKDSNEIHILNYVTPSSAKFGAIHSTIRDKRCDINARIISSTIGEQRKSGIADGTEIRYRTFVTKPLSHDSIVKQQTVKPAPRIFNSKSFTETTKTTPVKLEIVSNEVVNFSALEIQNILKQNAPTQSKATETIPQNNAAVEKQSNDTSDKVIDLGNTPEECSDSRSQKVIENDTLRLPRLQTITLGGNTKKDKNSFLPPTRTFVVRQAQIQILNSIDTPTEQVKFEYTNEEKAVRQETQTDTSSESLEKENKKATNPINNNNTELKVTQKLPYPTLLNSLLQKRPYIGATPNINISDHTSLNLGVSSPNIERKQLESDRGEGNNSFEGHLERNTSTEIVDEDSVNEQKSQSFTSLPNIDFQTEQVRKVEKPPRILNLELQEKIDDSLEIEKRQYKAGLESANVNDSKEGQITSAEPTDIIDKNSVNELGGGNLTSEKTLLSDDSQSEQEAKVEKAPAPPPRVLNLELQERKKVITDKSFFESTAANSCNQKKEQLQTDFCEEQQKSGATSVALNSKLQQDLFKKVNTLAAEPNPTKSQAIKEIHCKLFSVTKNENFRKDNTRCYGKNKTVNAVKSDDSSVEHNSDSDKVSSDVDTTVPKLKHIKKVNTSATVEKICSLKAAEKSIQQNYDVIVIDADEITPRRNTRREREEKTLKTTTDADLYVQSKTSGRKRKYVDYKLLSGISRYNSSDSDSTEEDTPVKKSATEKSTDTNNLDKSITEINPVKKRSRGRDKDTPTKKSVTEKSTDTNNQDKSTVDINPVKKRGRRPKRSEIKSSECNKEVLLDTSDSNVLNSEAEKQCDSSILDKHSGQDCPRELEIVNKQLQFDTSDSKTLNSEAETSTLDKHTGQRPPNKFEIVFTDCNKQIELDTSDGDVLNSETEKKSNPLTPDEHSCQGHPKEFEIKSTECSKQVQLDASDSDTLNSEIEKKCDPLTLIKHTDQSSPRKFEIKSTECNKLDTSDSDVLNSETENKCDPFTPDKHTGQGDPRKSEIKPDECKLDASDCDVLNSETEKQCDSSTPDKHLGQGRRRKSEIKTSDHKKQVQLDTSGSNALNSESERQHDSSSLDKRTGRSRLRKSKIKHDESKLDASECDVLNSETEKQCDKHIGRGRTRKSELKPSDCNKQVQLDTSDSSVLNSKTKRQRDPSSLDKRTSRGRSRKSEGKPDECKLDASECVLLNSETEKQCDSSTLDKHVGRGRSRKSEIKPSDWNKQIPLDISDSNVLNSKTERQRDSPLDKRTGRGRSRKLEVKPKTLDNRRSVQSEKRTSIVTSTPVNKLKGRRSSKRKVEISDSVNINLKTDSPAPGSPKSKSTRALLSKSAVESEPTEKRLRSYSKILLEKMNSAEKNSSIKKYKSSTRNSNSKKDIQLKSADASEKDSKPPIVEERRRGRSKKNVEDEEANSSNNKIDPEPGVENKSERKGRGSSRKTQEVTDDKVESSKKMYPKKISKNDKTEEVKKKRGRPKKINDDSLQSSENKTELGKNKTRSETKKPKIAEVNLSEDRLSSDIDFSNSNLNSSTDPLDIESMPDDQTETGSDTNKLNYIKGSPSDTPEKKTKSTEKKRRGRSKAVVNESELKCEAETERNPQNVNTESKLEDEEKNIYEAEPKKELDVKPQKRRGRKRKIDTSEKKLEESNNVTCAVCKSVLEESQWIAHSELKHNNLAWKINEVPLDLNDQALVERILSDLHKSKKVLHCELCECEIQTLSDYAEHKKNCTQKPDDKDDVAEPAAKKKLMSSVLDSLFSNISTPTKKEESSSTESTSAKEEAAATESNFVEEILPPLGANDIRCAVCSDVMPKGQWPSHKQRKHNNLAWKVGEKPLVCPS